MSLNKVMLIGNVGRDPEVRYLEGNSGAQNATKVASFTLATTERFRDRSGELRENTDISKASSGPAHGLTSRVSRSLLPKS